MSGSDDASNVREDIWNRWDDSSIRDLHLFCALPPYDSLFEDAENDEPSIKLVTGVTRLLVRFSSIVVLAMGLISVVYVEYFSPQKGLSRLFLPLNPDRQIWLVVAVMSLAILWIALIGLVRMSLDLSWEHVWKGVLSYGQLGLYFLGVLTSMYLYIFSTSVEDEIGDPNLQRELGPEIYLDNIVFISGFLFALLFAGLMMYDTTLRIENVFSRLDQTPIISETDRSYEEFKRNLSERLRLTSDFGALSISTAYLFSSFIVGQFVVVWLLGEGPQGLGLTLGIAINAVADLIILVFVFQSFVLIREFHKIVSGKYEDIDGSINIQYRPFHADQRGGLSVLGNVITRVNMLMGLAGLYYIYRINFVGVRLIPTRGIAYFPPSKLILWLFNFVGPIGLYLIVAGIWLYYTVWEIHEKMEAEKRDMIQKYQNLHRDKTKASELSIDDS